MSIIHHGHVEFNSTAFTARPISSSPTCAASVSTSPSTRAIKAASQCTCFTVYLVSVADVVFISHFILGSQPGPALLVPCMTPTIGLLVLNHTNILMRPTMALIPLVILILFLLITGVRDKIMWGMTVRMTTSRVLHLFV